MRFQNLLYKLKGPQTLKMQLNNLDVIRSLKLNEIMIKILPQVLTKYNLRSLTV